MVLCYLYSNSRITVSDNYLLSPNAVGLGEYGEVPVSLHSGIPQIEIPIYEISYGGHRLPIKLSYHGGGVRPDQHPGWTGIGWTLIAGGSISRVISDYPDESDIKFPGSTTTTQRGYIHKIDEFDFNWDETTLNSEICEGNLRNWYGIDTEPDKFSFNFCGISGQFALNSKGEWVVQCDRAIKIECDTIYGRRFFKEGFGNICRLPVECDLQPQYIRYFVLTDETGTKYTFGEDEKAVEFSINYFSQDTDEFAATTWNLKQIVYPDGRKIEFNYEVDKYVAQFTKGKLNTQILVDGNIFETDGTRKDTYSGTLVIPSYLKSIVFGNDTILFNREKSNALMYDLERIDPTGTTSFNNTSYVYMQYLDSEQNVYRGPINLSYRHEWMEWKKLVDIQIFHETELIRQFKFNYNDTEATNKQRLALVSLEDCSGSPSMIYKFEYSGIEQLPDYLADMTDHWGYFNNRDCKVEITHSSYNQYKEPNSEVMMYGSLSKISYPTGGYTRFIYEPHTYKKIVELETSENISCVVTENDCIAGGIRIKQIINSSTGDSSDEIVSKQYSYLSHDGNSSGILLSPIKYKYYQDLISFDKVTIPTYTYSSQTVLPMCQNSTGNHVGYSKVTEILADNSYIEYTFTNYDQFPDEKYSFTYQQSPVSAPMTSRCQERGLLVSQNEFDSLGRRVRQTKYEYEPDGSDDDTEVRNIYCRYHALLQNNGTKIFAAEAVAYKSYMYSMRLVSSRTTDYVSGRALKASTIDYVYNDYKLIKSVTRSLNSNQYIQTTYRYPFDNLSNAYCQTMTENHVLSLVVEELKELSDSIGVYPLERTTYTYSNPVYPESITKYYGTNLTQKENYQYAFGNNYAPKMEKFNDTLLKTYVWGYGNRYIVAEIDNAHWLQVQSYIGNLDTFAKAPIPDFTKLNQLREQLPECLITTYEYIPSVGLGKQTEPNGKTTIYEYDDFGRLTTIRDNLGRIIENYNYQYATQ